MKPPRAATATLLLALLSLLGGCGTARGWLQLPLHGQPSVGTSVSIPLGSGGGKK